MHGGAQLFLPSHERMPTQSAWVEVGVKGENALKLLF